MAKRSLPLSKVYGLLEPGPVVLLSTFGKESPNVMTMSWHTMIDFEPPLIGCVISNRNFSFTAVRKSGECVINIPTVKLAEQVVACGNTSGRNIDKFAKFSLTPKPAASVAAPLIDECFANLECKMVDDRLAAKYNFFILEVVKAWIDPAIASPRTIHHRGKGDFMVAGETIHLHSRMK